MDRIRYDSIGPARVMHLYDPSIPFHAWLVIDNTARGPALGGVRITPEVTPEEVARLARTMTFKSAIADLPLGGGKAGIVFDSRDPDTETVVRRFARLIADIGDYIPAPDMGSDETSMTWIRQETGRAVGLPADLGGLPLDQLGATGFGLAVCAETVCRHLDMPLAGARVAVQGFGNVGSAAARFLTQKGAVLVALSDRQGTAWNPQGLDLDAALAARASGDDPVAAAGGSLLERDAIFGVDCDILLPAATADVIREDNQQQIRARMVLEGANIPATLQAEKALAGRGVLVVPDVIANAGGLIMAEAEHRGADKDEAFRRIEEKLLSNTERILVQSQQEGRLPRQTAERIARQRVLQAMGNGGRPRAVQRLSTSSSSGSSRN
ncbi:glutamate dehydrogenase (NAD(P)+) [Geothermobacter ehrlichii]|uniref:Glutamate dehydrogenase n=1 Tax=Geothermobacter ehrlichii TaxID=213224 RepID=A0A5D3WGZ4_9BACT|nr:Glu/Leu/Phe/Val dehydrogenase [Geothermobacter ehrlichii]TYO98093.1 glutamate dehydrogenase (NAD(P)+) [Geothermobacter ehrlichii]